MSDSDQRRLALAMVQSFDIPEEVWLEIIAAYGVRQEALGGMKLVLLSDGSVPAKYRSMFANNMPPAVALAWVTDPRTRSCSISVYPPAIKWALEQREVTHETR